MTDSTVTQAAPESPGCGGVPWIPLCILSLTCSDSHLTLCTPLVIGRHGPCFIYMPFYEPACPSNSSTGIKGARDSCPLVSGLVFLQPLISRSHRRTLWLSTLPKLVPLPVESSVFILSQIFHLCQDFGALICQIRVLKGKGVAAWLPCFAYSSTLGLDPDLFCLILGPSILSFVPVPAPCRCERIA